MALWLRGERLDALRRGALAGGLVLCLVVSASVAPALGFLVREQALPLVAAADALPAMRSLPNPAQAMFAHIARTSGWPAEARIVDHPTGPGSLEAAVLTVYANMRLHTNEQQLAQLHTAAQGVDPELRDSLAQLLGSIADGQIAVQQALRIAPAPALRASMECGFSIECLHEKGWPETLTPLGKALMAQATADILGTAERIRPTLESIAARTPAEDGQILFQDPFRLVEVAGTGSNVFWGNLLDAVHPEIQVLALDLGGDDVYLNSAGGVRGPEPPVGPCVYEGDVQDFSLDCLYHCTYGCAYSVSLNYDLSGNDVYVGEWGQGVGSLGVGLLLEVEGNDSYSGLGPAQGAAFIGVGVLAELTGEDSFGIDSDGQGKGASIGLGVLLELAGDDVYVANWRVQGAGISGAVGWLVDLSGDDLYSANTVAQGSSDLGQGVGVLYDAAGSDSYSAWKGRGYVELYQLLSGDSNGVALFYDQGGWDSYGGGAPGGNNQYWFQGSLVYNPQGFGLDRE